MTLIGSGADAPPKRGVRSELARVAVAGNAGVLVLLVLIASHADRLLGTTDRAAPHTRWVPSSTRKAEVGPVVFVVVDGLRADTARDREAMPFLTSLADEGAYGIAKVECLIPSSVAAIETFITGRVPAPASFLNDFVAPSNDDGGIFAAIDRAGGTTFVAGPSLWADKYGRWIDDSEIDHAFGSSDERLLTATVVQLHAARHSLVVVHFGRADRAAHRSGAASAEYREAVRWCDNAVVKIVQAMPRDASIIVTSDHGNRDAGGHAGFERNVIETPVITRGADLPTHTTGSLHQRDVHALLASSLGVGHRVSARPVPEVHTLTLESLVAPLLAALSCLAILTSLQAGLHAAGRIAFPLNASVWMSIGLLILAKPMWAMTLGLAALAVTAVMLHSRLSRSLMLIVAVGVAVGILRTCDTIWSNALGQNYDAATYSLGMLLVVLTAVGGAVASFRSRAERVEGVMAGAVTLAAIGWLAGGASLAAVAALSVLCGRGLAVALARGHVALCGALTVTFAIVLARIGGNTLSLSTIDVQWAFAAVDSSLGVPLAAMLVVIAQALPTVALLCGITSATTPSRSRHLGAFAAGLAACFLGQGLVAVGLFSFALTLLAETLALGLLLRVLAETMYVFLGLALLVACYELLCRGSYRLPVVRAMTRRTAS